GDVVSAARVVPAGALTLVIDAARVHEDGRVERSGHVLDTVASAAFLVGARRVVREDERERLAGVVARRDEQVVDTRPALAVHGALILDVSRGLPRVTAPRALAAFEGCAAGGHRWVAGRGLRVGFPRAPVAREDRDRAEEAREGAVHPH